MKKTYCFDLDGTICEEKPKGSPHTDYAKVKKIDDVARKVNRLYDEGNRIIIFTARHMLTTHGDTDEIFKKVGKITMDWLYENDIKYHELHFGKPYADYYIDDKAIDLDKFKNDWS